MDFLPPLGYFEIRGSRALSYSDTPEVDGNGGNLKSMSAMPYYQSRSHEELRIEDFEIQKRSSFLNQNQGNTFQKSNSLFGPNPSPQPSSWSVFGTATAAKPPFGSTGFGVSPFSTSGCSTGNAFVHQDPRVSDFVTSTANVFSSTNNSGGGSSTNTFRFPSATLPEGLSISPLKFSSIPGFSVPYAPGFGMDIPSTPVPWSSLSFDGSSLSGPLNNRGPTTSGFASYSTSTSGSSSIFGVQTSLVSQGSTATEFQGSRITPQASTGLVEENSQNPNSFENIQSISAESSNKDKSHEELRLEYYGLGDKGRRAVLGDPFYRSSGLLTSDTPSNIFCDCTAPSSKQSNGYSPFQPFKSTFSEHERENLVTPSNTNSTAPTHPPFANPFSQAFTLQPPTSGPTLISKLNPPTLIPPTDPMVKNSFECSKTSTTSTTLSLGPFSFPKPSVIISPLIQSTLVTSSDPWSCLVNNASQPQQTVEKVGSLSTNELNKSQAFALQPPTASFGPTFTSNPNPLTLIPHVALMYIVPSNITSTAPTHPPFVNPLSQAFTHQPPTSSGPTFFSNLNPPTLIPSTDLMLKNSCECSKTSTAFTTSSVGTFSFSEPSIIISPSIHSTPVISSDPWSCLVNNTSQSQQAAEKVGSLSTNDLNKSSQGKADGAKDNSSSFQLNENSSRLTDDTATQLLNRHEDEVSATTERHEADVAALLPKLPDEEYYTEPSLRELAAKEMAEPGFCSQVKDFVVGRQGYGSIKFLGETDIRHVDLESVVQFNNRQVMIYPDKRKKPQVGQKLNKAAEVTLLNVKCIDKKTGKQYTEGHQLEKYEEKLIRKNQEQGMEFVSYDPVEGEWKFRVQHF